VEPDEFIHVAEASGLIIQVDTWVLHAVARQVRAWSSTPALAELAMSVNVSGRHLLSQRLPENVQEILVEQGIDPRLLTVEITETVLLDNLAMASAELHRLRRLGVNVAVDDFGTGYTSLAHLQHLPVDTIKIDRTFVGGLDRTKDPSLIRMITDLGHHLGAVVVTEGVETVEQLEMIMELGSDQVQGFLIARPMAPGPVAAWLAAHVDGGALEGTAIGEAEAEARRPG
jgi:EAL domain-containing protein (putative c-di-GMP-specific phosphodiesterase class I)